MDHSQLLLELSIKYGEIINNWLETNRESHRLYNFYVIAKQLINGDIEPSKRYNPESLKVTLEKFYPLHNQQIIIDDSGDESDRNSCKEQESDNNNKTDSGYVLKVNKLKPSSAYAKVTTKERKIISLDYKSKAPQEKPKQFDPQEQAIKLNNIKEKLYVKNYLHLDFDKIKKDEKEQENSDSAGPSSKCYLGKIPIEKSKREIKKGRRKSRVIEYSSDSDS